jgi:hypothetical protein
MSKSGSSAHWGGASPSGGRATRCRSGGNESMARSRPARSRSASGADSSRVTLVKSVRRHGSDSTAHMMASESFILATAIG